MENVQNRKRSFNINSLQAEEAERLSAEIGARVRAICEQACDEANKILNIYSMKAQMQIVIEPAEQETPKVSEEKPKKKRGRPRKDTQSLS